MWYCNKTEPTNSCAGHVAYIFPANCFLIFILNNYSSAAYANTKHQSFSNAFVTPAMKCYVCDLHLKLKFL